MTLFQLYDTHGMPLEYMFLELKDKGLYPNLIEFIVNAKDAGWKTKTIISRLGPEFSSVYGTDKWNKILSCLEQLKD